VLFVFSLRWIDPPTTAYIEHVKRERFAAGKAGDGINLIWVSGENISPFVKLAVIAAEDQKFPYHSGFDLEAIQKAVEHNRRSIRVRGASTISQQVAKNLFLWPGRTYVRKSFEVYFTFWIELLWPKERILEVYLNIAEFGDGIFGVGSASEIFFGKPASRLTQSESALLAAVLPSPIRLRVDRPSEYVRSRQAWILKQMKHLDPDIYPVGK
jgi:monofunctional glycosyltransferase